MAFDTRTTMFETAALPHVNSLYRAALSTLRNREDAEDVVQETYLRGWQAFDRFTPGTNCKSWLLRILLNVIRNRRRRKLFRLTLNVDPETLEGTLVYEPPSPNSLSDEKILAAFEKLPARFAEVVILVDVHDFSYKEAQQTLGVPIGTVMSRLSRGRRKLRQHLSVVAQAAPLKAQGGGRVFPLLDAPRIHMVSTQSD